MCIKNKPLYEIKELALRIDKARSVFDKRKISIAIFDEAFRSPQATYASTHIIQGRICAMWSAGLSAIFIPS